ncbi:YceI family protein [Carboxylicivirga marina]|uniref:YceI family protein n=1 Tax=Carboxylicivirga marina TaxID=2800988 RepID=A0ABS1HJ42_9BACT|nr:YceI family protein [Carboxylicivirga marina]MBK3517567.1 YceI family protein [Carboxylicivirga marina]
MKARILITVLAIIAMVASANAQTVKANVEASALKWTGTKVVGSSHYGFIKLKEGSLELKKGHIQKGHFVIDMKSMTNIDVENEEYNKKLIGHLFSDDFFGVETYPTATLALASVTKFKNNEATAKGQLTIKGQVHPVEFTIEKKDNDYIASITVDRTLYGIRYGSGSFFDNLGDKAISNDFTMDVSLVVE